MSLLALNVSELRTDGFARSAGKQHVRPVAAKAMVSVQALAAVAAPTTTAAEERGQMSVKRSASVECDSWFRWVGM